METRELSYVDLLEQLRERIENDSIPKEDKNKIMIALDVLCEKLWKYSY